MGLKKKSCHVHDMQHHDHLMLVLGAGKQGGCGHQPGGCCGRGG